MKKETNNIINLLIAVKRLISEKMKKSGNNPGISIIQIKTLHFIEGKKPTMREVADFLGITPPSATSMVSHFLKNSQVKKIYDKTDKRIIRLEITATGKKNIKSSRDRMYGRVEKILSKLNKRQVNNLKEVLETLSK
ncbi:winged helix-turn-helix transcriptional regulator [Candidatus Microgenomates bacterium]|nr:winged helix-turn-helix transcriptional regulator [Candidatus Microgenomates bacterium]